MAGSSAYPGAIDNFAEASPTNLGDNDTTGRTHTERHDDVEAAVEAIENELGVNPSGGAATVVARFNALDTTLGTTPQGVYTNVAARLDAIAGAGTASIAFNAGTATAPSFYFTGDTNTGLWSPGADTIAVSTGGSERLRVDSSGNVGIGTTSPGNKLHVQAADSSTTVVQAKAIAASTSLLNQRANGTTASPTALSSGDEIGRVSFQGYDGGAFRTMAYIAAAADGGVAASDAPGRLVFFTTTDGSTSQVERMRIDNAGLITGSGTSLGAWTAWTPVIGNTWAIGDGTVAGRYCQVGKIIHFTAKITMGSTTTFGASPMTITVPVNMNTAGHCLGTVRYSDVSASAEKFGMWRYNATGTIAPQYYDGNYITTTSPFTWASGDVLYVSGTYEAA